MLATSVVVTGLTTLSIEGAPATSASCTKAPKYTRTSTKFGVSLSTASGSLSDSLRKEEGRFGHLPVVRHFESTAPPSDAWTRRGPVFGRRSIVTSFRMSPQAVNAGKYDSVMRRYFSSAPVDRNIFWTFIHEPEPRIRSGQFSFAQYRTAWRRIATIASSYCRSNLFPTMILTGWTTNPASHRNWRDYYPGDDYTSVVAFDPYNSAFGDSTSYRTPSYLFDNIVNAARASGKPWGIAETGSNRIPGDSAGYGRAAWLKSMGSYFKTKGASFVTYYESTRNGDFELRDSPSINAYKTLVAGG